GLPRQRLGEGREPLGGRSREVLAAALGEREDLLLRLCELAQLSGAQCRLETARAREEAERLEPFRDRLERGLEADTVFLVELIRRLDPRRGARELEEECAEVGLEDGPLEARGGRARERLGGTRGL